jgi:hypothetical protein
LAAGLEDAAIFSERASRIFGVMNHAVGDDHIDRSVRKGEVQIVRYDARPMITLRG